MEKQIQNLPAVDEASTQMNLDCAIKALDDLKRYPKLLARLYDIMMHTDTSEDGERVFSGVEDAGEVYTILFIAMTGGADQLDTIVENMEFDDRATCDARLVRVTERTDEGFECESAGVEGEILIATDWA